MFKTELEWHVVSEKLPVGRKLCLTIMKSGETLNRILFYDDAYWHDYNTNKAITNQVHAWAYLPVAVKVPERFLVYQYMDGTNGPGPCVECVMPMNVTLVDIVNRIRGMNIPADAKWEAIDFVRGTDIIKFCDGYKFSYEYK